MAYNDFVQNIVNTDTDAIAFQRFMQGLANEIVKRRIAGDTKTLNYYLDFLHGLELVYSQASGDVDVNGVKVKTVTQAIKDAINTAGVANGVNANLVSYLPQIAGAVGRTQSDKNIERLSVKDFGAKGDGVTNDTQAFKDAAAAGETIFIPAGDYIVNDSIDFGQKMHVTFDSNAKVIANGSYSKDVVFVAKGNAQQTAKLSANAASRRFVILLCWLT